MIRNVESKKKNLLPPIAPIQKRTNWKGLVHSVIVLEEFLAKSPSNRSVVNKQIVLPWYRGAYCANGMPRKKCLPKKHQRSFTSPQSWNRFGAWQKDVVWTCWWTSWNIRLEPETDELQSKGTSPFLGHSCSGSMWNFRICTVSSLCIPITLRLYKISLVSFHRP